MKRSYDDVNGEIFEICTDMMNYIASARGFAMDLKEVEFEDDIMDLVFDTYDKLTALNTRWKKLRSLLVE